MVLVSLTVCHQLLQHTPACGMSPLVQGRLQRASVPQRGLSLQVNRLADRVCPPLPSQRASLTADKRDAGLTWNKRQRRRSMGNTLPGDPCRPPQHLCCKHYGFMRPQNSSGPGHDRSP